MNKYYLDKQYRDKLHKDTFYSYESGAYDNKYFTDYNEALRYANENSYMLCDDEIFEIVFDEEEEE